MNDNVLTNGSEYKLNDQIPDYVNEAYLAEYSRVLNMQPTLFGSFLEAVYELLERIPSNYLPVVTVIVTLSIIVTYSVMVLLLFSGLLIILLSSLVYRLIKIG